MKNLVSIVLILVFMAGSAFAFSTAPGYSATQLYSSSSKVFGLSLDNGKLYFGNGTAIKSLDLASTSVSIESTVGTNAGFAYVLRGNQTTYAACGTSSQFPWPYKLGSVDATGNFVMTGNLDGAFDGAMNAAGDIYMVGDGSSARIYRYSAAGATEVAHIGGYCGGLTFDAQGNLYFADQGEYDSLFNPIRSAGIRKFTPAQIAAGNLSASDGEVVLSLAAGLMNFDSAGNFYATHYVFEGGNYFAVLSQYDLSSGTKIADIASGDIANFVFSGNTMYLVDSPWSGTSTIQQIAIPEPATMLVLGIGGLLFARAKRS